MPPASFSTIDTDFTIVTTPSPHKPMSQLDFFLEHELPQRVAAMFAPMNETLHLLSQQLNLLSQTLVSHLDSVSDLDSEISSDSVTDSDSDSLADSDFDSIEASHADTVTHVPRFSRPVPPLAAVTYNVTAIVDDRGESSFLHKSIQPKTTAFLGFHIGTLAAFSAVVLNGDFVLYSTHLCESMAILRIFGVAANIPARDALVIVPFDPDPYCGKTQLATTNLLLMSFFLTLSACHPLFPLLSAAKFFGYGLRESNEYTYIASGSNVHRVFDEMPLSGHCYFSLPQGSFHFTQWDPGDIDALGKGFTPGDQVTIQRESPLLLYSLDKLFFQQWTFSSWTSIITSLVLTGGYVDFVAFAISQAIFPVELFSRQLASLEGDTNFGKPIKMLSFPPNGSNCGGPNCDLEDKVKVIHGVMIRVWDYQKGLRQQVGRVSPKQCDPKGDTTTTQVTHCDVHAQFPVDYTELLCRVLKSNTDLNGLAFELYFDFRPTNLVDDGVFSRLSTVYAAYKACLPRDLRAQVGCYAVDILTAFEDSISNVVVVISVLTGGKFYAIATGIIFVISGGNDNPYLGTVFSVTHWLFTVVALLGKGGFIPLLTLPCLTVTSAMVGFPPNKCFSIPLQWLPPPAPPPPPWLSWILRRMGTQYTLRVSNGIRASVTTSRSVGFATLQIDGFGNAKKVGEAFVVLANLKESTVYPSEATNRTMFHGVSHCVGPNKLLKLLCEFIVRVHIWFNLGGDTVTSCLATNSMTKEIMFLSKTAARGYVRYNSLFNIMMACLVTGAELKEKCEIIELFGRQWGKVSLIVYLALVVAWYKNELQEEGVQNSSQVIKYVLISTVLSCNNMILNCLPRAKLIDKSSEDSNDRGQSSTGGYSMGFVTNLSLITGWALLMKEKWTEREFQFFLWRQNRFRSTVFRSLRITLLRTSILFSLSIVRDFDLEDKINLKGWVMIQMALQLSKPTYPLRNIQKK